MNQAQPPPGRLHFAWLFIWTCWGSLIGLLIYRFDRDVTGSLNWLAAGFFIGSCGIQILRPLAAPFRQWYQRFQNSDRLNSKLMRIYGDAKNGGLDDEEIRERIDRYFASDAWPRIMEESIFGLTMAISPLAGLFYGTLFGGILGSLCPISPELHVTAGRGALLGVFLGQVLFAFLVAVTCAITLPIPKQTTRVAHLSRRLALLVSPVLIIPAAVYCLKKVSGSHGFQEQGEQK